MSLLAGVPYYQNLLAGVPYYQNLLARVPYYLFFLELRGGIIVAMVILSSMEN